MLLSILKTLEEWDQWLFMKVNSGMANPFFDVIMPFLRNGTHWAPLYLFLAVFVAVNFGKKGLWWMLFFIVTVALTDMIGTYVFKHNVLRLRPCNDPDFFYNVRLLVNHCSGGSSFTSNHAANHFGMGTFFLISFYRILKKWAWIGIVWAVLIAYAQVYVGVHYPLDVLAGALLGILVGLMTGKLFNNRYGFPIFDNKPTMTL